MSDQPPGGDVGDRQGPGAASRQPAPSPAMKRLELPTNGGPWSVRRFSDRNAADAFYQRLQRLEAGHTPPVSFGEPILGPDSTVLPAGSWIVLYRPILGLNAGYA